MNTRKGHGTNNERNSFSDSSSVHLAKATITDAVFIQAMILKNLTTSMNTVTGGSLELRSIK